MLYVNFHKSCVDFTGPDAFHILVIPWLYGDSYGKINLFLLISFLFNLIIHATHWLTFASLPDIPDRGNTYLNFHGKEDK